MLDKEILELKDRVIDLNQKIEDNQTTLPVVPSTNTLSIPGMSLVRQGTNASGIPKKQNSMRRQIQEEVVTHSQLVKNADDLQDSVKMYEYQEAQKKDILNGMDRLVKAMLKTTTASVGVQVEGDISGAVTDGEQTEGTQGSSFDMRAIPRI
jgi:hypothetical protein